MRALRGEKHSLRDGKDKSFRVVACDACGRPSEAWHVWDSGDICLIIHHHQSGVVALMTQTNVTF